jgi:DNA-binding GntR family transcriptional regulator
MVIVRGLIEGMAARIVNRGADSAVLARLTQLVDAMEVAARERDVDRVTVLDSQFHESLCASSRVDMLLDLWLGLRDVTRLVISNSNPVYSDPEFVIKRHRAMLQDLQSADVDIAELRFRNRIIEHGFTTLGLELPDWVRNSAVGRARRAP